MSAPGPHLLLTDSGLGGLAVCAGIERIWRDSLRGGRLTFFNAAPGARAGYNDLPDTSSRAALLDGALAAMERLHPDRILLACNTLSALYEHTAHARSSPRPAMGILETGLALFARALSADPDGDLLLLGTRTTIESGVYRDGLLRRGLAPQRLAALSCHGLARAIESDPDGPEVRRRIAQCAAALPGLGLRGRRLYVGLACTHYGFAAQRIGSALRRASGLPVTLLDPNPALAAAAAAHGGPAAVPAPPPPCSARPEIDVRVLSKVPLAPAVRRRIAARLAAISLATARALRAYTLDAELFP